MNTPFTFESQGLYVTVYTDHVEVQGRDFFRKTWIPQADFNIPEK